MNRTRTGLVAALLAASVGLTGCGSSNSGSTGNNGTNNDNDSSHASTASYTPLTKDNWAGALAKASKANPDSHLTIKMGSMVSGSGDVSMNGNKMAMKMTMKMTVQGKTLNVEERLVDGVIYMNSAQMLGSTDKWMKIDANTPGMGKIAGMLKNYDPAKMAAVGKEAITSFNYDGTAKIDGDTVQHYTVKVDPSKAVNKLGLGSMLKSSGASMPASVTEEVYLGADNTVRRITTSIEGQDMQIDRSDLSSLVKVSAPPAADVVDMSDMLKSMSSSSAG